MTPLPYNTIENDEYDSDELRVHCHSDLDLMEDPDPYFEYQKCHQVTQLENKIHSKFNQFEPISISRFEIVRKDVEQAKVNYTEEIEKLINRRYLSTMQDLVYPDAIIDKEEKKVFEKYLKRDEQVIKDSSITDYEEFAHGQRRKSEPPLSLARRVQPVFKKDDFKEFMTATDIRNEV